MCFISTDSSQFMAKAFWNNKYGLYFIEVPSEKRYIVKSKCGYLSVVKLDFVASYSHLRVSHKISSSQIQNSQKTAFNPLEELN